MRTKQDFIKVTTPYTGYVTPINTAGPILYPLNLRIATCIDIINANIPLFEIVGDKAVKLTLNNLLDSTVEAEGIEDVTVCAESVEEEVVPTTTVEEVDETVTVEAEPVVEETTTDNEEIAVQSDEETETVEAEPAKDEASKTAKKKGKK